MKYMGSKRSMLKNGLGELLEALVPSKATFYDLFCGGGSVAGHVAQRFSIPVCASDLQKYAVVLAAAQIEQTEHFDPTLVWQRWQDASTAWLAGVTSHLSMPPPLPLASESKSKWRSAVASTRLYCSMLPPEFPLSRAYGGYYFSAAQAMTLDALRHCLPDERKTPTLAALIDAASSCAAAPGHTAQPFGTRDSALPHLAAAWHKNIPNFAVNALQRMAGVKANIQGQAIETDALAMSDALTERDVAFIDPPYSEVQYSRFYHVLEAVARGDVGEVFGTGRYPKLDQRPQSLFCRITQSAEAFDALMVRVATAGAEAIVTFPSGMASNGLSGELVESISAQYFKVRTRKITSLFSTLGGNAVTRDARATATELVLHLAPR